MAGSNAPSVVCEDLYFVENGAAGTYTGTVVLPAGATLIDVIVHGEALWTAGTSATMKVGDTVDDDGIFIGVNLKATDLLAGESISANGLAGGKHGADLALDYTSVATIGAQQIKRRETSNTAERTMSATVTTVGTAGFAGRTRVLFIYAKPTNTKIVTQ